MNTILFVVGIFVGAGATFIYCRDIIKDLKAKLEIAEEELNGQIRNAAVASRDRD